MQAMITRHITLQDISMAILVKTRVLIIITPFYRAMRLLKTPVWAASLFSWFKHKAKRAVGKEDDCYAKSFLSGLSLFLIYRNDI
jgi:hypothetical protein